jgi:glycosyltransferase involved in cell wall biosynthesis
VLWQTWADLELIVVDDGSTDGTAALLGQYEDPRLRVLRHESGRGAAAARNVGIAAARGSWIAFQDSDDIWLPHKLERQMALVGRNGAEPAVAWCGMLRVLPARAQYEPSRPSVRRDGAMLPNLLWGPMIGTQTMLVRRDALEAVGGFVEALRTCEDWDLALRLARKHDFAFEDEVLVIAPKADDGLSMSTEQIFHGRERVFEQHRPLFAAHPEIEASNLYHLGYLAMINGEVSRARGYFKQALRRQPRSLKYATAWASAFVGARTFREAHDLYGRLVGLGRTATGRIG